MTLTKGRMIALVLSLTGRLPLWACRCLGRLLGLLLWLVPNRNRSTTSTNIARCFPELSTAKQRTLAFHSLQHTGMLSLEMAAVWKKPQDWLNQRIVSIHNKNLYDEAQRAGKGVILLLPHVGNWEVFGTYIPTLASMMALYEPPKVRELEYLIKAGREKTGAMLVPTNQRGVAALLKQLRSGGTACVLPDQVPNRKDRGCVIAPFFGQPALTMTLVSQLIAKTDCRVLGATAKRVRGGFKIEFWSPNDEIYKRDIKQSAAAVNQLVERCARAMPAQYQWEYKRFKAAESGQTIYE